MSFGCHHPDGVIWGGQPPPLPPLVTPLWCQRVCHWTPTTAFVGHRHVPSAANQHTSWWSLIRCCWTSRMEQSANPAARVGHYTWTVSTSTQKASIWSLTAAAPSDSVFFRALCTNSLTYLLSYLLTYLYSQNESAFHKYRRHMKDCRFCCTV